MALRLACTKFTSSYAHTLTISDPVYTTKFTSIFTEKAVSSDYFSETIVDIAQETEGSCHPSPVNEVHDFSLSHFEGGKVCPCCWAPRTDLS